MASAKTKRSIVDPLETGIESVHSISKKLSKHAINEAEESGKTFLSQLLGLDLHKKPQASHVENHAQSEKTSKSGGEIFNFMNHRSTAEQPKAQIEKARPREAAMNYSREIAQSSERASKGEMREMNQNIQQIKAELSKLVASSQVLKLEFATISVEQSSETVGQYHLNFFEWLLTVIRSAREKVEDSGAWLGTVKGKGTKKGYWGMFKKHGTTFGLSGERSVATQVG